MSLQKVPMIRSSAIRKAAEGEACTICNRNDGTTVFCHLNESWAGKGLSMKASDLAGMFLCHVHHEIYDGRAISVPLVEDWIYWRAMYRTWARLVEKGIITIKGRA